MSLNSGLFLHIPFQDGWALPLGSTADGHFYFVRQNCSRWTGKEESHQNPAVPHSSSAAKADDDCGGTELWRTSCPYNFTSDAIKKSNGVGENFQTNCGAIEPNALASSTQQSPPQCVCHFPNVPIRFFQRPVLSSCQRFFYAIGKEDAIITESISSAAGTAGGTSSSSSFLPSSSSQISKFGHQPETLVVVRIALKPQFSLKIYKSRAFANMLFRHHPGIFCCGQSGHLLLSINYTAYSRELAMRRRGFPDDHRNDFPAQKNPFVPIELPPNTGDSVRTTCFFQISLHDSIDAQQAGFVQIEHFPVPFPPTKPNRIVEKRQNRRLILRQQIPDNLRMLPLTMDPLAENVCLFTLNTNGRAHLFDGKCWHSCEPEETETAQCLASSAQYLFDRHHLFHCNGRIFLILRSAINEGMVRKGPLYEVFVNSVDRTFRLTQLCQEIEMPCKKSIACALPKQPPFFAYTTLFRWKDFFGIRPSTVDGKIAGYIRILVFGMPYPLKQLCFWRLQKLYWPSIDKDKIMTRAAAKRQKANEDEEKNVKNYINDDSVLALLQAKEDERREILKKRD